MISAVEWIGHKEGSRTVRITLDQNKQRIVISEDRKVVRTMDISKLEKKDPVELMLSVDVRMKAMLVRVPKEYDLVRTCGIGHFLLQLVAL